jgi:L-serine/L-threonine ammonia-lyase
MLPLCFFFFFFFFTAWAIADFVLLFSSNIYLKLDNLQPSGSFKSRGIGNFMTRALASRAAEAAANGDGDDNNNNNSNSPSVRFYCTSGGNAGLACATSALSLKQPATIALPVTSPPIMRRKLEALGADVHVVGANFAAADRHLRDELLAKDPTGVYVPPYDHPDIWAGAATIVDELRDQLRGHRIDAIACSVGGGGLVNGIMQAVVGHDDTDPDPGSHKPPPPPTQVLAVETVGADALNASVRQGHHVTIPAITSIAVSLGASRVAERTWRWSQERPDIMQSLVVSDADAALACVRFADDARLLIEVSCGASIALAYRGDLRRLVGGPTISDDEWALKNVVLEVCGGSAVSLDTLAAYREKYASEGSFKV